MPNLQRGHGRVGRPWSRIAAELRALHLPCWLCGQAIDYDLPVNDAMAFTVDHLVPLSAAPWLAHDRGNLRAAHRRCNSRKGDGSVQAAPASRAW